MSPRIDDSKELSPKPIFLAVTAQVMYKNDPRNTSEQAKQILKIDNTFQVTCSQFNIPCETMLLGEFSPIEEGHHLLKIEKIAPTEKDQVTWINQFIFVNVGLVEANEDYLKGVLSIKIVSFLMAAILGYFAFRKIDSGSSSIFRLRLVFIFLLLNLQPFLLLDPTLYQEYFIVHQLTFALYYSFLVHYWMAELHSFVFHVMSSPRTTADQDEELQVPSLVPKILTAVRNLKSPHNLRFFSPPTSLETL